MNCPISGNPCSAPEWWPCLQTVHGGSRPMKYGCHEDALILSEDPKMRRSAGDPCQGDYRNDTHGTWVRSTSGWALGYPKEKP